jgi:hypothetical protein
MKIFKMTSLALWALLLTGLATPAAASKLNLVVNGKSFHMHSDYKWNEKNYGMGVEYEFNTQSRWIKIAMANGFRDSDNNMSYMVGAGLYRRLVASERFAGFYLDAGINAFMMTREDVDDNKPFPALLPSITVGNNWGGFNLSYVPKSVVRDFSVGQNGRSVDRGIGGVFFLQAKIRLDDLFKR